MTTTHSAGPWRYDYEPGYCGELIAADGTTICTFIDEPKTKDAMVMSAAPELLEALEKRAQAEAAYAQLALSDVDPDTHERLLQQIEDAEDEAKDAARAAIRKAKGEQQ